MVDKQSGMHGDGRAAAIAARDAFGYLTASQVAVIAGDEATRLDLLLIRWHEGRALVPAQYVAEIIRATEAGGWCVRDAVAAFERFFAVLLDALAGRA